MDSDRNLKWLIPASLSGLILAVLLQTGTSQAGDEHNEAHKMHSAGDIVSLESILDTMKGIRAGKIIETELEEKDGRYVYELELVDADGQVWEYNFDARTGKLLKHEQEDD